MKNRPTDICDCFLWQHQTFQDERGIFLKVFQESLCKRLVTDKQNLRCGAAPDPFKEIFFSTSRKNVIRGMHFQIPPYDQEKCVFPVQGAILDVLVDLRQGSPSYLKTIGVELNVGESLWVAKGVAHGFLAKTDNAIVAYAVTSEYAPNHDCGILWNSFGFNWPVKKPIISARDLGHPLLKDFKTPFIYD